MTTVFCAKCHGSFDVPDELLPGFESPDDYVCEGCEPYDFDDREPDTCPYCGKEYEDFSDMGCRYCDRRSPEWGLLP